MFTFIFLSIVILVAYFLESIIDFVDYVVVEVEHQLWLHRNPPVCEPIDWICLYHELEDPHTMTECEMIWLMNFYDAVEAVEEELGFELVWPRNQYEL